MRLIRSCGSTIRLGISDGISTPIWTGRRRSEGRYPREGRKRGRQGKKLYTTPEQSGSCMAQKLLFIYIHIVLPYSRGKGRASGSPTIDES